MPDKKNNKSEAPLSAAGFGIRFAVALALVLLTFNPSGFSAYHFNVESRGESFRNARSTHTQSFYVIGPAGR